MSVTQASQAARNAAQKTPDDPAVELGSAVGETNGRPGAAVRIPLAKLTGHGLVAGAPGTGRTRTLQLLAEQLSAAGVPVVVADLAGRLSGLAAPGAGGEEVARRARETGTDWSPAAFPVEFYALGGAGTGAPVRATVASFGPLLLARVLGLDEAGARVLARAFEEADQAGHRALDLRDLRKAVERLAAREAAAGPDGTDHRDAAQYHAAPAVPAAPTAARPAEPAANPAGPAARLAADLAALARRGAGTFFGEPEFDTADLMRTVDGHGVISLVELAGVHDQPALFSAFLMWLLADSLDGLESPVAPAAGGEAGRARGSTSPRLVFVLDEARLLFRGASEAFVAAVAETVRLAGSRGVGIIFATCYPTDLPQPVLAQLGRRVRIQHALPAGTPEESAALERTVRGYPRARGGSRTPRASRTPRTGRSGGDGRSDRVERAGHDSRNGRDSQDARDAREELAGMLASLRTGEAAVSVGSTPAVTHTLLRPPRSLMSLLPSAELARSVDASALAGKYRQAVDRDAGCERLASTFADGRGLFGVGRRRRG